MVRDKECSLFKWIIKKKKLYFLFIDFMDGVYQSLWLKKNVKSYNLFMFFFFKYL